MLEGDFLGILEDCRQQAVEGMGELHCHQLDTEDKLWNFHLLDRKDKVELSFHLLDRGDKEEPSFHRLDKKDKEELSFHLLDMEDKQEQWQMVDSQDHYPVEAEQDTEAFLMQEDKVVLQDRMGKEHMHQALQKEDSYHWHSLMNLKEAVVDSMVVHSVDRKAVVLALEDSSDE